MWTTILSLLTPIVLWGINRFILGESKKAEYIRSYHKFLATVDKSGSTKVENHLSARAALKAEQKRLADELAKKANPDA
jgi:hypothetical protein